MVNIDRKPVGIDLIPDNVDRDWLLAKIQEREALNRLAGYPINEGLLVAAKARLQGEQVRYASQQSRNGQCRRVSK